MFIAISLTSTSAVDINDTQTSDIHNNTLVSTHQSNDLNQIQSNVNKSINKSNNLKKDSQKTNPSITFKNITAKTNTTVKLSAKLPSDATGNIVFKINNKTITNKISLVNGTGSYSYKIPLYSAKTYSLSVVYSGNSKYNSANATSTLTLTKLNTTVKVSNIIVKQNQNSTIKATIYNELGNYVNNTKVVFKVNGKAIGDTRSVNGIATIKYNFGSTYNKFTNTLSVISGENSFYSTSSRNSTISLIKKSTITLKAISSKTGSVVTFNSTVLDLNKNPINTGLVDFKLNNKLISSVNVKNGLATYTTRLDLLDSGTYSISATYRNNTLYQTSSTTNKIILSKLSTHTNATNITMTIGQTGQSTINVYDQYGRSVSKGTVTVQVNKQTIGTYTLIDGQVKFNYTPANKYSNTNLSYVVKYNENAVYTTSTCTGSIIVNPLNTVYVDNKGSDSNLGDMSRPFKTISYAVSHVALNGIVYLNDGTYNENKINIKNSVNVLGFNSNPDLIVINANNKNGYIFNISSNATVVMKNIYFKNAVIKTNNTGAITSSGSLSMEGCVFDNDLSNAQTAASSIYASNYLLLQNCTVKNSRVYQSGSSAIINVAGTVILSNVKFINNTASGLSSAGPSLYLFNSNSTIYKTEFINNKVTGTNATAGAVRVIYGNATFNCNIFKNNYASGSTYIVGGAISSINARVYIINSTLTNNSARSQDSTAGGGAIYTQNSVLLLYNTTLNSNYATGINTFGGSVYAYMTYSSISYTKFEQNYATSTKGNAVGGAITARGGTIVATYNKFTSNIAKGNATYAGAIYFIGDTLNITKTSFTNNAANGTTIGGAGSIYANSNTIITNCNFTSNKALGKSNGGGAIVNIGNLTVTKTNLVNNVASAAGSEISNAGTIKSINGNYWGSSSPTWSKLLYKANKPSTYSKTRLSN